MSKILLLGDIKLRLERWSFSDQRIIGTLYFGDYPLCNTLENYARAIKTDSYRCFFMPTPSWSRFHGVKGYEYQIRLEDKNGREGILFHVGNTAKDSEGCILVGSFMPATCDFPVSDRVYYSKLTYSALCSLFLSLLALCTIGSDSGNDSRILEFDLQVVNR